jgi:hypothetical protein
MIDNTITDKGNAACRDVVRRYSQKCHTWEKLIIIFYNGFSSCFAVLLKQASIVFCGALFRCLGGVENHLSMC